MTDVVRSGHPRVMRALPTLSVRTRATLAVVLVVACGGNTNAQRSGFADDHVPEPVSSTGDCFCEALDAGGAADAADAATDVVDLDAATDADAG